jgi:hypothetical protein
MRLPPIFFFAALLHAPLAFAADPAADAREDAEPPSAPAPKAAPKAVAPRVATVRVKPKAAPAPALPAPSVTMSIATPSPDTAWTMHIENTGTVPLRVLADARYLTFDVTAPGAKKSVKCTLPREMRAHDEEERALVIPPGRGYSEKLDPRLFCFGARDGASLVVGANVVAHLGWPVGRGRIAPPYIVTPIEGLEPAVAAAKEIVSSAASVGSPTSTAKEPDGSRTLAVTSPSYIDIGRGADIAEPVTVANASKSSVTFLLRPETLAFDVAGPSGIGVTDPSPTVRCESDSEPNTSIRDVFTTLAPKGRTALTVMLAVLCPEHTFDHSGLYVVRARLDTRASSGREIPLRTFDADVPSDVTTRVRVRRDVGPQSPRPRPKLDDPPHP